MDQEFGATVTDYIRFTEILFALLCIAVGLDQSV
jgi:hypothetical protein